VALLLDPLPQTKLVLCRAQQTRLLLSMLFALQQSCQHVLIQVLVVEAATHIVEDQQHLALSRGSRSQRPDPANARRLRQRSPALRERGRGPLAKERARWANSSKGGACKYHGEGVERLCDMRFT
jgi:hypothetical protein